MINKQRYHFPKKFLQKRGFTLSAQIDRRRGFLLGFTLIELQVSFIIAGILVLMIGAMSSISTTRFQKLREKSELYNDLSYGFELVQSRARSAQNTISIVTLNEPPWVGQQLIVDNGAFGLYKARGNAHTDFVYLKDKNDEDNRNVLLSVSKGEELNLTLTNNTSSIVVKLKGTKDDIPFDLSSRISRRIQ